MGEHMGWEGWCSVKIQKSLGEGEGVMATSGLGDSLYIPV